MVAEPIVHLLSSEEVGLKTFSYLPSWLAAADAAKLFPRISVYEEEKNKTKHKALDSEATRVLVLLFVCLDLASYHLQSCLQV